MTGCRTASTWEQLTYLMFLKMADEQYAQLGGHRVVPVGFTGRRCCGARVPTWSTTTAPSSKSSARARTCWGWCSARPATGVQDPAKLERLIKEFVDRHEWLSLYARSEGRRLRGLDREDRPGGRPRGGPVITPRALIPTIVDVMLPGPDDSICDPACGHRRILPRRLRLDPAALPAPGAPPDGAPAGGSVHAGRSRICRPGCAR